MLACPYQEKHIPLLRRRRRRQIRLYLRRVLKNLKIWDLDLFSIIRRMISLYGALKVQLGSPMSLYYY